MKAIFKAATSIISSSKARQQIKNASLHYLDPSAIDSEAIAGYRAPLCITLKIKI
jgi:hypothetical protein